MNVKPNPEIEKRRRSLQANIAWYRAYRKLDGQELARKLRVSAPTLKKKLETDPCTLTVEQLIMLTGALGTTVEDLISTKALSARGTNP